MSFDFLQLKVFELVRDSLVSKLAASGVRTAETKADPGADGRKMRTGLVLSGGS